MASLTGRLELLVEDAERADEEQEEEAAAAGAPAAGQRPRPALLSPAAQAQPAVLAMPRRVAVPWVQGARGGRATNRCVVAALADGGVDGNRERHAPLSRPSRPVLAQASRCATTSTRARRPPTPSPE